MPTYQVVGLIHATTIEEVEADTPEEAPALAAGWASLCHQCASQVELGDTYGFIIEDDVGNEVYTTESPPVPWQDIARAAGWRPPEEDG